MYFLFFTGPFLWLLLQLLLHLLQLHRLSLGASEILLRNGSTSGPRLSVSGVGAGDFFFFAKVALQRTGPYPTQRENDNG